MLLDVSKELNSYPLLNSLTLRDDGITILCAIVAFCAMIVLTSFVMCGYVYVLVL